MREIPKEIYDKLNLSPTIYPYFESFERNIQTYLDADCNVWMINDIADDQFVCVVRKNAKKLTFTNEFLIHTPNSLIEILINSCA